ncbi:MAG: CHAD domain-containing protein [Mangrovicoccus sp.]|nr:CHAD domain-containing protein [Mangrovicoccus sp.]
MSEIELKFLLDEAGTRTLKARLKTLEIADDAPRTRQLRTVYFDTPDLDLRKAKIALRLRRDGRRWIQTVKIRARHHGGLSESLEYDSPSPGGELHLDAIPNELVRDEITALVGDKSLAPVCETAIRRSSSNLTLADGSEVELAIDSGEIKAGELAEPFREAELELIKGRLGALFDLTHMLFPEGGLHFSTMSKAERGYLLAAEGRIADPIAPRNACKVPLARAQSAETAARDVLRECFEQIASNAAVVQLIDDHEGPHQLRVGLRRLRSAFSVFKPLIGNAEMLRLNDEARWLGQVVGDLRDLDVAIEDILDPAAAERPDEPGFEVLRNAIVERGGETRLLVRETLAGERAQTFLIDMARFIETRGWLVAEDFSQTTRLAAAIPDLAVNALDKRWKSVRKHAKDIENLDIPARHELRKELKKMRYAVEFMGPLWPATDVKAFVKKLKALQEVFGDLNDAAMVETLLMAPNAPGASDLTAQRATGWLLGTRMTKAEADWPHAQGLWAKLKELGPFWT